MNRPCLLDRVRQCLPEDVEDPIPGDFVEGTDSLLRVLAEKKVVSGKKMQEFLSKETGIPRQPQLPQAIHWPHDLPERLRDEHAVLPLSTGGGFFGIVWPQDIAALDELAFRTGEVIDRSIITQEDYQSRRQEELEESEGDIVESLFEQEESQEDVEVLPSYDLLHEGEDETDDAPVIKLLNHLILRAYRDGASDVHVEPEERGTRVRYRVDGVLREATRVPKRLHNALVSRIKIMSELDIAEKRAPQDGRMKLRVGENKIDVRVSTIPSVFGEKVVMRLLNSAALIELEQLGFCQDDDARFRSIIGRSYGIILVTGPTGSGKTTTLYSTLKFLNSKSSNIITIEDPVEYQMENISQIQVNRLAGIDFASGLKSILRQDPDIIMIGEMRDEETASIAVKAALTGHLVFSTLHTNDAPGAYARLCDMNVAPYLLASSISGVLAQRLVRKICTECRIPDTPDSHELKLLGVEPSENIEVFKGEGCKECDGSGYRGRIGIYELLTPTPEVKKMILAGTLEEGCEIPGFRRMVDDGRDKVLAGITSAREVCKVVRKEGVL